MFRDILSGSRAIFIGVVFFMLCVGGSLLYSWHVHRTTDAELAETRRKVQPLKSDKAARTAANTVDTSTVDFEHAETSLETDETQPMSDDTGVSSIDETSDGLDLSDAFLPEDFVLEEAPVEEVPVSPFGFGHYPEIPEDYPHAVSWINPSEKLLRPERREHRKRLELIDRVMVKAWTDGDQNFVGATGNGSGDGKVYLTYPNVMYVEYGEPYENRHYINLIMRDRIDPRSKV